MKPHRPQRRHLARRRVRAVLRRARYLVDRAADRTAGDGPRDRSLPRRRQHRDPRQRHFGADAVVVGRARRCWPVPSPGAGDVRARPRRPHCAVRHLVHRRTRPARGRGASSVVGSSSAGRRWRSWWRRRPPISASVSREPRSGGLDHVGRRRPSARDVLGSRVRDTERLAEIQQAVSAWHATQRVRQRERRLRTQFALAVAGPVLSRVVASRGSLDDQERLDARLAEGRLRDELRGADLLNDAVRNAIDSARRRGAVVTVFDEGGFDGIDEARRVEIRDELAAVLIRARSARLIIRSARDPRVAVTVVGRAGTRSSATMIPSTCGTRSCGTPPRSDPHRRGAPPLGSGGGGDRSRGGREWARGGVSACPSPCGQLPENRPLVADQRLSTLDRETSRTRSVSFSLRVLPIVVCRYFGGHDFPADGDHWTMGTRPGHESSADGRLQSVRRVGGPSVSPVRGRAGSSSPQRRVCRRRPSPTSHAGCSTKASSARPGVRSTDRASRGSRCGSSRTAASRSVCIWIPPS